MHKVIAYSNYSISGPSLPYTILVYLIMSYGLHHGILIKGYIGFELV